MKSLFPQICYRRQEKVNNARTFSVFFVKRVRERKKKQYTTVGEKQDCVTGTGPLKDVPRHYRSFVTIYRGIDEHTQREKDRGGMHRGAIINTTIKTSSGTVFKIKDLFRVGRK